MSTTSRILVGFLLFLAAGFYILERRLTERVERQYLEAAEEPMVDMAQIFAALVGQHVTEGGTLDLETIRSAWAAVGQRRFSAKIYNVTKTAVNTHLYVTDRAGRVLFDSDGGRAEGQDYSIRRDVRLTLDGEYGARSTKTDPADEDSSVMFVAAPIRHGGEIIGVASVSKPQRSMFPFRDETTAWIRNLAWVFLLAMTAGAYLVVTLFSRPIRRLTDYARAIARGERATPPEGGSPETVTLGRAFEEMRDALEDRRYVENYVETLTHEMKSPVAAIRGAVELLREDMPPDRREKFLGNIHAESRRLQNIIDRLLALSALEARKTLDCADPVALTGLAAAVCEQLQPAAESRGLTLLLEAGSHPVVSGEPFLLEMALANLVQNALDFSPAGGVIRLRIAADASHAEVVVEDEGPGIPDYALPRIFERFYSLQRPATGRKSSGLGLCFVREAAELHRGTIAIANRTGAPGASATLRLPLGGG